MKWRGVLLGLACLLGVLPILGRAEPAHAAASFYFSPSSVKLNVGQTATVTLYVSSADQSINAAEGTIVLPAAYVSGVSVSKTGSVFSLWPEEPSINGASIHFAGGKPSPGYQGSGGKILSFTIRGTAEGTGLITLTGGRIIQNDTNVYSGAGTSTVSVTRTVSGATISSTSHPDQNAWYQTRDAALSWTKPSGATSYSYTLTHSGTEAAKTGSGAATSANFTGLADGIWTLSLTTTYSDGKTAASSFTVRVDDTDPSAFTATVEQQGTSDPRPILKFKADDQPAGIDHYEILIDGKSIGVTSDLQFQLPVQVPGTHNFVIRAFDKAGNTTDASGTFTVEGFAGPTITHWPNFISVLEPMFFKGRARYDAKILLHIDGQVVGEFLVKENLSDDAKRQNDVSKLTGDREVEWSYNYRGVVPPGRHVVYAHQQRPDGALSNRSNEVQVIVLWTVVSIFGMSVPTVLIGFIGMFALMLILIAVWYRFRILLALVRRRIDDTEKEIDQDLESLEGSLGKENSRLHESIQMTKTNIDYELDGILRKKHPSGSTKKNNEPPKKT